MTRIGQRVVRRRDGRTGTVVRPSVLPESGGYGLVSDVRWDDGPIIPEFDIELMPASSAGAEIRLHDFVIIRNGKIVRRGVWTHRGAQKVCELLDRALRGSFHSYDDATNAAQYDAASQP